MNSEHIFYGTALYAMATEDSRYRSNYNLYLKYDEAKRLWWIKRIEAQAKLGQGDLADILVAKVIALKLQQ